MLKKIKAYLKIIYICRTIIKSGLFDAHYYLKNNLDVARSCINPVKHYVIYGWREGRNPNPGFDTRWYLETYPDVRNQQINPFYHYIRHGLLECRMPSPHAEYTASGSLTSLVFDEKHSAPTTMPDKFKYREENTWKYSVSEKVLLERVRNYNAQKKNRIAKTVVYTAIIGNYDPLILPEFICNDWDYVCFSDVDIPGEHIFEIRKPDYHNTDPTRMARYIKTHPHFYFPNYDYSIWIDAHLMVKGPHLQKSLTECVNRQVLFMGNPHPHRNCTYDELARCIALGKDNKEVMKCQIERYKKDGFPKSYGLLETGILIRKHNKEKLITFNESWWNEINNGSRRDQLSVMYLLWKLNLPFEYLSYMMDVRLSENKDYYLFLHRHKANPKTPAYKQPSFMRKTAFSQQLSYRKPFSQTEIKHLEQEPIDIVITVHNAFEDVKACLESVCRHLLSSHRVFIIDDGSEEETKNYLVEFSQNNRQFMLIRNSTALGYTKSANRGLRESSAPFVILLNSDTIVCSNWAVKLLQTAQSSPEIGIVGPLSNAASWQSIPLIQNPDGKNFCVNQLPKQINIEQMDFFCEENGFFQEFPKVPLVNGFCYGIKRNIIDSIGLLDEKLFPKGYGEEDDFSLRALKAGFCCAIATHCYVYHAKSKSFGSVSRNNLTAISQNLLAKRHGRICIRRAVGLSVAHPALNHMRKAAQEFYDKQENSCALKTPLSPSSREHSVQSIPSEDRSPFDTRERSDGKFIPKEQVLDTAKFQSFIAENRIDFFEFGCSKGDGLLWVNQKLSKQGVGFDIDPKKLEETVKKGFICTDCNILDLPDVKHVKFSTFFHMLEHLESSTQAEIFIAKACQVSLDNIYIRQPFFDAEPYLFYNRLKTYYTHWKGHKNLMTTPIFYYILEKLRRQQNLKEYIIAFKSPIKNSASNLILPLSAPIDSTFYEKNTHPPKSQKITFAQPHYREILISIDVRGNGHGELWPAFQPFEVVFDSRKDHSLGNIAE